MAKPQRRNKNEKASSTTATSATNDQKEEYNSVDVQIQKAQVAVAKGRATAAELHSQWRQHLLRLSYMVVLICLHQWQAPITDCLYDVKVNIFLGGGCFFASLVLCLFLIYLLTTCLIYLFCVLLFYDLYLKFTTTMAITNRVTTNPCLPWMTIPYEFRDSRPCITFSMIPFVNFWALSWAFF